MTKPKLRNDCFALPQGVDWTPVDEALDHLRDSLTTVVGTEKLLLSDAGRRILAEDVIAQRANPPAANSAVDGYGFDGSMLDGDMTLPLVDGRAAAGVPYEGVVPKGSALRILTGAVLPDGVDTVVLEEDCLITAEQVAFAAGLKPGANARRAGEDLAVGELALKAGQTLRPQDLALGTAVGTRSVTVYRTLRIGVLSTGDELAEPAADVAADKTFDANRPMLLDLCRRWHCAAVDLGQAPDDRAALKAILDEAAQHCDVVLTSGGASAGDEDHVSAVLKEAGALSHWRIALKPGRPLALGVWQGMPIFGLPGNPVAAFVCSLVFAYPAIRQLSGADWQAPQGFLLPASFEKRKKQGRREYLRARLTGEGSVEVFRSEGSGRISGLSWSDGLVELPDGAADIRNGDLVRYIPYASFGL
ncbi:MAG: gephyrin-like molybdotransferase Glp [Pseudomonadota bacterium]